VAKVILGNEIFVLILVSHSANAQLSNELKSAIGKLNMSIDVNSKHSKINVVIFVINNHQLYWK